MSDEQTKTTMLERFKEPAFREAFNALKPTPEEIERAARAAGIEVDGERVVNGHARVKAARAFGIDIQTTDPSVEPWSAARKAHHARGIGEMFKRADEHRIDRERFVPFKFLAGDLDVVVAFLISGEVAHGIVHALAMAAFAAGADIELETEGGTVVTGAKLFSLLTSNETAIKEARKREVKP